MCSIRVAMDQPVLSHFPSMGRMGTEFFILVAVVAVIQIALQSWSTYQAYSAQKQIASAMDRANANLCDIERVLLGLQNQRLRNLNEMNKNLAGLCEAVKNIETFIDECDCENVPPADVSFNELDEVLQRLDDAMQRDWEDDRETQRDVYTLMQHVRSSVDAESFQPAEAVTDSI
jgi:hypothetical protein